MDCLELIFKDHRKSFDKTWYEEGQLNKRILREKVKINETLNWI